MIVITLSEELLWSN